MVCKGGSLMSSQSYTDSDSYPDGPVVLVPQSHGTPLLHRVYSYGGYPLERSATCGGRQGPVR